MRIVCTICPKGHHLCEKIVHNFKAVPELLDCKTICAIFLNVSVNEKPNCFIALKFRATLSVSLFSGLSL